MTLGAFGAGLLLACPLTAFADTSSSTPEERLDIKTCHLKQVSIPFETSNALEGLGGASIKTEIESGDKTWKLLPTFNDPEQAIESIKNKSSKAINLLREEFDLPEFSSESWDKYRAAIYRMYEREGCPSWYVEGNDEINALESFFDIYENEDDNEEIENTLISAQISPLSTEQDQDRAEEELLEMLPDQNVLNENGYDEDNAANEGARARKDFNVAKGVAYAKKYAGSKNFPKYAYFTWPFGGDCTNFASQILEAGGVKQVKSSNDKKGWWHKSHNGAHAHSQSWIKARTFAKYMGVSYKTKSHKSFSKKVKKGDFIAFDDQSDGNIDHMGFVTATSAKTYKGANDYQVAQHGKDYLAWMSSKTNGWEDKENGKTSYCIVRR